ncbi:hypothetical protein SGL43_00757 [Streptomyces globisporus]|uniref:Uncharacterized protein n=1 Tax=Streptomyces globisporus TaxID=1908 RepID=A0ABM9GQS3_STRGL|nr:hypothetical protein SGL43_00757 [Streptomyces globisporus]
MSERPAPGTGRWAMGATSADTTAAAAAGAATARPRPTGSPCVTV